MAGKKDVLKDYQSKAYPPLEKPEADPKLVKAKEAYQAVVEMKGANRTPRFRIIDEKGVSYGCSYAHLLDWIFTPPALLTLNTATRIFTFRGKHLEQVERLLVEERIKELHTFNINRHTAPQEDETVIEEVEVTQQ